MAMPGTVRAIADDQRPDAEQSFEAPPRPRSRTTFGDEGRIEASTCQARHRVRLLFAHVLEHMERDEAVQLVRDYLPYVRPGGKVMFVCPQERGYASDATHVHFCDSEDLRGIAAECGLEPGEVFSFPFPRFIGPLFVYNEFNLVSRVPVAASASSETSQDT